MTLCRLALLVCFATTTSLLEAALVELRLNGTVSNLFAENASGEDDSDSFATILPFAVGDPLSAIFRFDTAGELEGSFSSVAYNNDNLNASLLFQIGNTRFEPELFGISSSASVNSRRLRVGADRNSSDPDKEFLPEGWSISSASDVDFLISFLLVDLPSEIVLPSPRLPTPGLTESEIENLSFILADISQDGGSSTWETEAGSHTGRRHDIRGTFTSLSVTAVPEPSSALFTSTALLLVGLRRRRRLG